MSEENPILDALELSVIINRRDKPGQVAWTEWRANVAFGCPAAPGSIVMTGAGGTIDPCLLPSTTGLLIEVGGVPVLTQNLLNFIAGTGITIVPDAFGGITFTATGSSSTVSVNGTTVTNPNFNNTTPAAQSGFTNVIWQTDGSGNVSASIASPLEIEFNSTPSVNQALLNLRAGANVVLTPDGLGGVFIAVTGTPPTTLTFGSIT